MKKITHSVFYLLFAGSFLVAQNQNNTTENRVFDEKKAYEEAAKKGIPESDRKGYVEKYLKPKFFKDNGFSFDTDSKTMRINLTPPQVHNANCPNAEFEQLNFTGWTGDAGTISSGGTASWAGAATYGPTNSAPNSNWSADIMTTPPTSNVAPIVGYDPIAINPVTGLADIPLVAPTGGVSSVRLGNEQVGAETERVIYSMAVSPANAQFTYQYAVVLQDPNHSAGQQPFFKVTMRDGNGVPLTGCGQYQVDATQAASDPTYINITYQFEPLYYKPWTVVSVDLSAYIGQTITIEFQTADCTQSGHFGYAYIDASCGIIQGTVNGYCTGSTQVLLTAPTGFTSYQWSGPNSFTPIPGGNNDSIIVSNPNLNDTFYVQMVNAAGCTTVVMTLITPSTLNVQSTSMQPTCPGGSSGSAGVVATGGLISGYNYVWSTAPSGTGTILGTTQTITNLPQDTVFVNITSGNCPPKDTFVIVTNAPVTPSLNTVVFCNNTVLLNAPSDGLNYQWYDFLGFPLSPNGTNDSLTISSPVNGQVWSIAYNDSTTGCRDSIRFTLSQSAFNTTAAPSPSCFGGTNGSVSFSSTAGFGPYTYYTWGPSAFGDTITTASTAYIISNLANGTYTTVVNTPNCYDSLTFVVNQIAFSSTPSTAAACFGGNTGTITASSTTTGMSPYNYSINGPGGTQSNASNNTTFTFNNLSTGTYTLTVTANNGNCVYDSVITVAQNPLPTVTATDDICPSDTTNLTSSVSGGTHQWYLPNGTPISGATSQVYTASPAVYGTYLDSAADASGCQTVYTITLTQTAYSAATTNVVNNPCYLDSVGVISVGSTGGNTPYTYVWSGPGGYTGTGSSNSNLNSGVYTIFAHGGNCKDTITVAITEPPQPNDTLIITTSFCDGDTSAVLGAPLGFTNYQWYYNGSLIPGATNDSLFILNPGSTYQNYSVTYIIAPCERKTIVIFRSVPDALFTPDLTTNVFSPNGDNKNEYFHPFYNPLVSQAYINYAESNYTMRIYNRWGQLEFESTDYATQWNGKNKNGKECSEGTYFWVATYVSRCGTGTETTKNGYVQLVR